MGLAHTAPNGVPASRDAFEQQGLRWPLTIDHGHVIADRGSIYFRAPDGTTYALNGLARQHHQPVDLIHLEDPAIRQALIDAGADPAQAVVPRVSVGPLIALRQQR